MKHDKMVATNKVTSRKKVEKAKVEMEKMLHENLKVSVGELVVRTGLSRGFFYKNEEVARALERTRELQHGRSYSRPQKVILDQAMNKQIELLQKQIKRLKEENDALEKENIDLKKALNKKDLKFIKNL